MNFFNLGAPKLIPYAYVKLMDSLLKRWYTRSINHCSQLSTTGLSDHGSHSKSKWFRLGSWGDRPTIIPRVQFIFHIHSYILMNFMCALQNWKSNIFQNHILSLNNRLPFNLYAGNIVKASHLNYNMMLSTYNLTLNDYIVTLKY